jgi:hypothetical protein
VVSGNLGISKNLATFCDASIENACFLKFVGFVEEVIDPLVDDVAGGHLTLHLQFLVRG